MLKIKVVCQRDKDGGFALAGVDAKACEDASEARQAVVQALDTPDLGVLLIEEKLMSEFDPRLLRRLEASERPLVVSVPLEISAGAEREYLERVIRRVMGYQVRLK